MLHIVSCNHNNPALQHCLSVINSGDEILLIESAVENLLLDLDWPCPVYALEADLQARGLKTLAIKSRFQPIGDNDFVELCVKHPSAKSWF